MKLSNIAVIFIVIVLPVLLILGYYISLQIDTINMQTAYNTKLLESTKEAIEAFEINTVEWNEDYSDTADSKRRDIMASINTFTTSLANNLGVAGTSKDYMMSRIPAIAYTLYDGYYIYSPAATKSVVKNENGVAQYMSEKLAISTYENEDGTHRDVIEGEYTYVPEDEGKLLYVPEAGKSSDGKYVLENGETKEFTLNIENAKPETTHMLKPFMAYSEQIYNSKTNEEATINYTLDNYVTVYGKDSANKNEYIAKSGYLNKTSNSSNETNVISISDNNFLYGYNKEFIDSSGNLIAEKNPLLNIRFSGQEMKPELLTETIAYYEGTNLTTATFNYVYEAEKDVKIYYDPIFEYDYKDTHYNGGFFRLDSDLNRIYVKDLTEELYKKCSIPTISNGFSYLKTYQSLVDYKWYTKDKDGKYVLIEEGALDETWDNLLYHDSNFTNRLFDYSAINYCVEAYVFTEWFNNQGFEYIDESGNRTGEKIKIEGNNDPELDDSIFTIHKREIIRQLITENLKQAITNYSRTSSGEFTLPELKESEWEQVVSNISVVTFLQNIPIGLKYYNNYAIATSTTNKEYVNTRELYFYNQENTSIYETIYHAPYCEKYAESSLNLIGYRSIDYMAKYYEDKDGETRYYFRHSTYDDKPIREACYYCIVQRALSGKYEIADAFKQPYYTTIARERYLQLESITIEQSDINVKKTVYPMVADYGDTVKYTIIIENKGAINDTVNIVDYYNPNGNKQIKIDESSWSIKRKKAGLDEEIMDNTKTVGYYEEEEDRYEATGWEGVPIDPGESITITYEAEIAGNIGERIDNTAKIYTYNEKKLEIARSSAETQIIKKVKIENPSNTTKYNIVLVLDHSHSMEVYDWLDPLYETVTNLYENVQEGSIVTSFHFLDWKKTEKQGTWVKGTDDESFKNKYEEAPYRFWSSTDYRDALQTVYDENLAKEGYENIILFLSDGTPAFGLTSFKAYEGGYSSTLAKNYWNDVEIISNNLKNNYKIFCINFGDDDAGYGLKNIISSFAETSEEKYYAKADSPEDVENAFASLNEAIQTIEIENLDDTESTGKINIEKIDYITSISVDGEPISEDELTAIKNGITRDPTNEENGTLNLNDFPNIFHKSGDIEIIY